MVRVQDLSEVACEQATWILQVHDLALLMPVPSSAAEFVHGLFPQCIRCLEGMFLWCSKKYRAILAEIVVSLSLFTVLFVVFFLPTLDLDIP
jgi:hypothetical protein